LSVDCGLSVGELLGLAAKNASGDWEENFVTDLETRFETYGERTHLSPKQLAILERIADPIPAFEPLNGRGDDGYVAPRPTLAPLAVFEAMRAQLVFDLGHIAEAHPEAPAAVLRMMLSIAADHGWRFAPDKPTREMCEAWSNEASPFKGTQVARAHAEIVYREMMQKVPTLGAVT